MGGDVQQQKGTEISMFASYMGQDTVIMLKLIGQYTSDLLVGDTVVGLWDIHHGSKPGDAQPYTLHTLPSAPESGMPPGGKAEYAIAPGGSMPPVNVGGGGGLYPKT